MIYEAIAAKYAGLEKIELNAKLNIIMGFVLVWGLVLHALFTAEEAFVLGK